MIKVLSWIDYDPPTSDTENFKNYLLPWAAYFLTLIAVALLLDGTSMDIWMQGLSEAAKTTGYGDPNSYAAAAMDISQHGWVTPETRWVFNLWPPGLVMLEALLLKLFGLNSPMPLLLLVCSAALYSTIMMDMWRILKTSMGRWGWFIPLLIFAFPTARFFLLNFLGLLFGEWLAIGCFVGAILALTRGSLKGILLSGVLFAGSAYARSQYELILNIIFFASVCFLAFSVFLKKFSSISFLHVAKHLFLAAVIAQIFMAPWRLFHLVSNGAARWVFTFDTIVEISFKTDERLIADGQSWMLTGGVNVPCHLEPEHCGKNDIAIFKRIFIHHPFEWISAKASLLPKYWFCSTLSVASPQASTFVDHIFNGMYLFCLVMSLALLWFARGSRQMPIWWGIALGLGAAHALIITFAHLEARYFYLMKIFSVFSFIMLFVEFMKLRSIEKLQANNTNS